MFLWEFEAHGADRVNNHDLEVVDNLGHEGCDLLHKAFDTGLASRLEQRGNSQCGDGTIRIIYEAFHVHVAGGDSERVNDCHLVQRTDRGKTVGWLGRTKEKLQHCNCRRELSWARAGEATHGSGCLIDDHVALMAQTGFKEVKERTVTVLRVALVLIDHLLCKADEKALC